MRLKAISQMQIRAPCLNMHRRLCVPEAWSNRLATYASLSMSRMRVAFRDGTLEH